MIRFFRGYANFFCLFQGLEKKWEKREKCYDLFAFDK